MLSHYNNFTTKFFHDNSRRFYNDLYSVLECSPYFLLFLYDKSVHFQQNELS